MNTDNTTNLGNIPMDAYDYVNSVVSNPTVILILVFVVILYLLIFMNLGNSDSQSISTESSNGGFISIIIIVLLLLLLILNGFYYLFGIDIVAKIKNIFTAAPQIDINVDLDVDMPRLINSSVPEFKLKKQVFNIPGNNYIYSDAKALCTAYGGRLATYEEVEDAYKDGAEWCNYGWSEGQMALFPTQQKTFDDLQKIEGHEHDCGRPGVNGGYMSNENIKYGVNCYGYKRIMTKEEEDLMATMPRYPKTEKDLDMDKRVDYWKSNLDKVLISPFNHNSWSRI
jgi:hypothetical protein